MKHIILFIFLLIDSVSFGATRFWVGGGSSANWNATGPTNWSATSGGSNNATVPGASDDVTFNGLGGAGNTASTVSANITVLSLTFTSGYTNTVTINTAVTLTIAGNFTDNTAHSWTVSGTGAMTISATSTITSGGETFPGPVSFSGANTKTLSGNWTISGALTVTTANTVINWTTNETLSCAGLTMSGATASGTAKIILTGGTWSGNNALLNDLDIAGNVTVSGGVTFSTKTLTYVSGTVTTTGSTLTIAASSTLNTNGITWNNITMSATSTLTINSLLSATGTFTINAGTSQTFAGTSGFNVANLSAQNTSLSITYTFNDGVTYIITTSLLCNQSRPTSPVLFTSDDATNKAIITLQQGATCNVLANFTRIDASGGRTIRTFNGTVTSCVNVVSFNDIGTSKH